MKKRVLSLVITLMMCVSLITFNVSSPILGAGTISGESSRTTTELKYNGNNTGVMYTNIKTPSGSTYGQNNIDIVEFKLSNKNLTVEAINNGQYVNSIKTVKSGVTDYNNTHSGKSVLASTNADLFFTNVHSNSKVNTGGTFMIPRGIQIIDGEIWCSPQIGNENLEATNAEKGNTTPPKYAFGMTSDYQPLVGIPGVDITIKNNTKNKTVSADGLNRLPANHSLIVYNNRVANSRALTDACEVVVQLNSDAFRHGATLTGTVKNVYPSGQGGTAKLAPNCVILTARGSKLSTISGYSVGDSITINCSITASDNEALWQNCIQAVGGHMPILINGTVATQFTGSGRWPYTLIGYKADGTVVMTTVDGRQSGYSVGVMEKDLADFCKEIGYNSVFWLDGGGSTTMLTVDGSGYVVRNRPSDGAERSVANSVAVCWNTTQRGAQGSLDYIIEPVTFNALSMDFPNTMAACFNTPNDAAASFVDNNVLKLSVTKDTPDTYMTFDFSNAKSKVNASAYKYIVIRMRASAAASSAIFKMYLCPGSIAGPTEACTASINGVPTNDQYNVYVVDLSKISTWSGNLNSIRLDFFDGNSKKGDYVEISQFGFAKTAAEADMLKTSYANGQTHQWGEGVITTPPAPGKEGVMTYTCTHCGETKTEAIAALPGLIGDVNNDGSVNGQDSVLLLQHLAGWEVTVDEYGADIDGNGKVEGADSVLLLQYLAGWDISYFKD